MKLVALKDAYKVEALEKGLVDIKTFRFDNLSDINQPDLSTRILLFKPPDYVRQDDPDKDYLHYAIDYFLFDLVGETRGEDLATLWESINDDIVAINKGIADNNTDVVEIVGTITFSVGNHREHNKDLIGIRSQYILRVFDCINP